MRLKIMLGGCKRQILMHHAFWSAACGAKAAQHRIQAQGVFPHLKDKALGTVVFLRPARMPMQASNGPVTQWGIFNVVT